MAKFKWDGLVNIEFTTKEHPNEKGGYINIRRRDIGTCLSKIMQESSVLDIQHVTITSV